MGCALWRGCVNKKPSPNDACDSPQAEEVLSNLDSADASLLAGDFVAGDLSAAEEDGFRSALGRTPQLQREVAFWQVIAGSLQEHGRPEGSRPPSAGFTDVLRHRLQREAALANSRRPVRWSWMSAAAAALVAIALMLVVNRVSLQSSSEAFVTQFGAEDEIMQGAVPLTLGMSSSVASFARQDGEVIIGLRVMQVAADCPAQRLGIRPGDIVLAVDNQEVHCPWQLSQQICNCGPNDVRKLTVFHPQKSSSSVYDVYHEMVASYQP